MLNGRSPHDSQGEYTFCSATGGQSIVDYILVSTDIFPFVSNFLVGSRDESDHFPISCDLFGLKVTNTTALASTGTQIDRVRYRWDSSKRDEYMSLLEDNTSQVQYADFMMHVEQGNVNKAASGLTDIIQRAAYSMKCRSPNTHNTRVNNKQRDNAEWWSADCEMAKTDKQHKLRTYRNSRSDGDLHIYLNSKRIFKSLCRKRQYNHNNIIYGELRKATRCSSEVWASIKKINRTTSAKSDNSINVETWFNHFKELLTCEPDIDFNFKQMVNNYNDAHASECPTCIDNEPDELNKSIEISEITDVIKHLRDGKQPGIDGLSYEFFKNCNNNLTTYLCYLFNVILDTGIYPSQWSEAIISPLHKKGSKSDVSNYRGLSLLCTISKIFTKILNTRLMTWAERNGLIDEAQGAYRKGRSTTDHIFTLHSIIQKHLCRSGGRFYVAFIDFSRAFDSVPHSVLWYRMLHEGVHGKIFTVFKSMYAQLKSCVKTPNGLSDLFLCTVGTRQGCMVSPFLFALYIDELVTMCNQLQCPSVFVDEDFPNFHLLMYADDICIVNDSVGRLQNQLNVLGTFCQNYGLGVNLSKTKVITFRNGGPLRCNERFFLNGSQLECVGYYKYLGIVFTSRLCWSVPLQTLSAQAEKALFALKRVMKTVGNFPISLSLDLFDKLIVPILLYGSEVWGTQHREPIELVHRKFCKYIMSVSYNTSNAAVLGDLGRTPLSVLYKYRCIKFWLKIVHDNHTRLRNSTYNLLRQTHENRGGTWVSEIKFLLYSLGFGNVWNQHSVGNIEYFLSAFKQRLLDTSRQTWHADVMNNCKLNMYSLYKSSLVTEEYLLVNMYWKHKSALARFRCANHKLAIERGRVLRQERNTRICKYCINRGIYIVEDEFHVLLVCKLFHEIRVKFIYTHFRHVAPSEILFIQIMSSKKQPIIKDLAAFTYNMFKIHDDFNCTL